MERAITFRGMDLSGKWVEGSLVVWPDGGCEIMIPANAANLMDKVAVIAETVGQFTGETSRDGKRIFEGDIVRYETIDGEMAEFAVVWGSGCWELEDLDGHHFRIAGFSAIVEVVGNVHE